MYVAMFISCTSRSIIDFDQNQFLFVHIPSLLVFHTTMAKNRTHVQTKVNNHCEDIGSAQMKNTINCQEKTTTKKTGFKSRLYILTDSDKKKYISMLYSWEKLQWWQDWHVWKATISCRTQWFWRVHNRIIAYWFYQAMKYIVQEVKWAWQIRVGMDCESLKLSISKILSYKLDKNWQVALSILYILSQPLWFYCWKKTYFEHCHHLRKS